MRNWKMYVTRRELILRMEYDLHLLSTNADGACVSSSKQIGSDQDC